MISLSEADKILKNTYLYMVNDGISGKTAKLQSKKVVCLKCGNGNKTLHKIANGYICNDCLKELKDER